MGDEPTGPIRRIGAMSAAAAPFDQAEPVVENSSVLRQLVVGTALGLIAIWCLGLLACAGIGMWDLVRWVAR